MATGAWDGDKYPDLIVRDTGGIVHVLRLKAGTIVSRSKIIDRLDADEYTIADMADWDRDGYPDLIVRHDPTGQLWLYAGGDTASGLHRDRFLIGTDWQITTIIGVTDWDRDGHKHRRFRSRH